MDLGGSKENNKTYIARNNCGVRLEHAMPLWDSKYQNSKSPGCDICPN